MTESEPTQPSEHLPAPTAPPAADPPPGPPSEQTAGPPRAVLPWLCGLGFLVLAVAIALVWQSDQAGTAASSAAVAALHQQVQALQDRVAALEQRPAAAPPADLGPLNARLNALAAKVDALPKPAANPPAAGDTGELGRRLDADEARLAALEKQTPPEGQLTARLDALSGQVQGLASQRVEASLASRLDTDEARLTAVERNATQGGAAAEKAARLARIAAAQAALQAGRPLGAVPDAPPAVVHFATTAPPTLAALRQGFTAAAKTALAARQPTRPEESMFARALSQAEQLVTVRRGDRVLVGDPAAGIIAKAQAALDVGDLAGAVSALSGLAGAQAAAMAPWLAQAKAVLDARNGLADMAARD